MQRHFTSYTIACNPESILGQGYFTMNWVYFRTPNIMRLSKCKGLKMNPQYITPSHYINNRLPQVDNLIPITVVKDPIGDIEKYT